jgi:hypothetical protein
VSFFTFLESTNAENIFLPFIYTIDSFIHSCESANARGPKAAKALSHMMDGTYCDKIIRPALMVKHLTYI